MKKIFTPSIKRTIFCFVAFIASSLFCFSQVKTRSYVVDPELAYRAHSVNFTNMRLEVAFEPEKSLVKGNVTLTFTPYKPSTDSIWLDGVDMTVKKLTLNGKDAKYKVSSEGIVIYPESLKEDSKDSLNITYECNPHKGIYFIGWNDPNNISRKEIWTQGEGTDNRNWIPMYDFWNDKMITETIVTFDKDYEVLSNGTKVSVKENKDGTKTWHYKMTHPHSPYLVMLGIGKYGIEERKSKSGVPLHLYYYPDQKDRVIPTYKYSAEMIDFYEKEIGVKYGWESYSQIPVQDFMYGAMENTTATVYGDFLLVDDRAYLDRNYIGVNAHELAHQWFGDMVTCLTGSYVWLHENFATYYSALFDKEIYGKDYFDWERRGQQNSALDAYKKDTYPISSSMGGTTRNYPQGAFVLNMLKYVVGGREVYNKAIKYYLEQHKYQNVDAHDLLRAFEESTGMSLDWFWDEWYFRGGIPNYIVNYSEQGGATQINVTQVQELTDVTGLPTSGDGANSNPSGLFKMPIWFEVHYTDGSTDKKQFWIEKQSQMVSIPNPSGKKIDYVLFDPDNQVMKSVTFTKTPEMLKAQASKAENLLDRYDAVAAMKSLPPDSKRDFLIAAFHKETFHPIKDEVVAQLINDSNSASKSLIREALTDKEVSVRKAVLSHTKTIPASMLQDFAKLLSDSSYDVIMTTLDKLSNSNPSGMPQYLQQTKGIIGTPGRKVEIKWLELSALYSTDNSSISKLVAYTSNSYEFATRATSMQALQRLNYFDEELLANILNAVCNPNGRLSGSATDVLKYYLQQDKAKKLITDYIASHKWEPWQMDAIKKAVN